MRKQDANRYAQLAEDTADAFESGRIEWGQHAFYSEEVDGKRVSFSGAPSKAPETGQHCLVGGLMRTELGSLDKFHELAASPRWQIPKASEGLRLMIRAKLDQDTYLWNDAGGRTKEEIIDILKDVAKDLRNGDYTLLALLGN